jgi:protein SCO1/2
LAAGFVLTALAVLLAVAAPGAQQPRRYAVTGMVLEVAPSRTSFVVSHDAITGLMAAMTMSFEVRSADALADVTPGSTVTFTLVVSDTAAHAEQVKVVPYRSVEQDPLTAYRLALLKRGRPSAAGMIPVGQRVPDFRLTDQARQPVSLSQFRGKVVAVNFIYTSCALPQFCYRIANHFGVVQKRFQQHAGRDLVLLTVTFDPARDTPEKLADYARQWKAQPEAWRFLTGTADDIKRVCAMFGVEFFPDEGLMNHSIHTAVIDRQGTLVANIEGNRFSAAQLGDLVETALKR